MKQVAIIITSLGLLLNAVHVHCCLFTRLPGSFVCCDCPCLPPGPCPEKQDPHFCPDAKYSLDPKGIRYPNKNATNVIYYKCLRAYITINKTFKNIKEGMDFIL